MIDITEKVINLLTDLSNVKGSDDPAIFKVNDEALGVCFQLYKALNEDNEDMEISDSGNCYEGFTEWVCETPELLEAKKKGMTCWLDPDTWNDPLRTQLCRDLLKRIEEKDIEFYQEVSHECSHEVSK